ncbi:hypothetical protein ONZ45_g5827 [Pleurotus djamor]|nr:hypothetical protein ONZ45_g5827 [Pleurotus djamor]
MLDSSANRLPTLVLPIHPILSKDEGRFLPRRHRRRCLTSPPLSRTSPSLRTTHLGSVKLVTNTDTSSALHKAAHAAKKASKPSKAPPPPAAEEPAAEAPAEEAPADGS